MNLDNIMINLVNHLENQVNKVKQDIINEVGHLIYCPELDIVLWNLNIEKIKAV